MARKTPIQNTKKKQPGSTRRLHLAAKWFIVLLLLLVVVVCIFAAYLKQQTNPDRVVNEYISVFMAKDASALFRYIGFEEGGFINPDAFSKSIEECHKYSAISTYGLTKYADPENPDQIQYNIEYRSGSHSNPYTQTLVLHKSEKKQYLFFDKWEMDYSEFLATNCSLNAPAGATVMVDGITLAQDQAAEQTDELTSYHLDQVFIGTHSITVTLEGFDDFSANVSLQNADYDGRSVYTITASMLTVSPDMQKTLTAQTEKMIRALYAYAIEKDPFEKLNEKYPFEENVKIRMEQKYNALIANNITSDNHLTKVDFTKFKSSFATSYSEDRCYAITVTTNVDHTTSSIVVKTTINDEGISTGVTRQERSAKGSSLFTTTFHYKDGTWYVHDSTALDTCVYYIKY